MATAKIQDLVAVRLAPAQDKDIVAAIAAHRAGPAVPHPAPVTVV